MDSKATARYEYNNDIIGRWLEYSFQFPVFKIDGGNSGSNLPAPLHRTVVSFEKSILECHFLCEKSDVILNNLEEKLSPLAAFHDQLDQLVDAAGLKGKQCVRAYDVYGWNMSLITSQTELLRQCRHDCAAILEQVEPCSNSVNRNSNKNRSI